MRIFRNFTAIILALTAYAGLVGQVGAASEPYQIITAPEVKHMIEEDRAVLVHSLSEIEFEIQHIPGSINIPIIKMRTTEKLPKDKNTPLIFYCMGLR